MLTYKDKQNKQLKQILKFLASFFALTSEGIIFSLSLDDYQNRVQYCNSGSVINVIFSQAKIGQLTSYL